MNELHFIKVLSFTLFHLKVTAIHPPLAHVIRIPKLQMKKLSLRKVKAKWPARRWQSWASNLNIVTPHLLFFTLPLSSEN